MKIHLIDENNFIIYLNHAYIDEIDFDNKMELECYFKTLFSKLKTYYDIQIQGYYNINVYIDDYYGMILSIHQEEIEYFDYMDNQVDMRILVSKDRCFLYLVEDVFTLNQKLLDKGTLYHFKGATYFKLNEELDQVLFGTLLEHATIVYQNAKQILKYGKQFVLE